MTEFGNKNECGQPLFHLRRIGPAATVPGAADVMCFYRVTNIVGRYASWCDFLIDSSSEIQGKSLSRCHARIVRQAGNQHKVCDDSLNGMFVNNIKIAGSCVLHEGDRVTFGNPLGSRLPAGSRARQPNSEHQFIFEQCKCVRPSISQNETRPVSMNSVTAVHKRAGENKDKTESSTIDSNNSQSSQSESQKPAYKATIIPAKVVTCKCALNNAEVHTVADQVSKNLNDVQGTNDQSITSTSKSKQNDDIKNLQSSFKKNLDSKESKMGTETEFSKDIELVPIKDTFDDDCNDEMHTPETEPSMNVKETATVHKETLEVESNVDMDDAYQCSVTPEDMNITSNMKQKETEKSVNSYQPNNIVDRNEDQELDLSTDIVEASICNTDEDAGSGDEILPTNLRFMSKNTPEKQFENMDILNRNISAKIMSLHIERSSSNWISESETQSPVIARQGIDTAVELTSNFGKKKTDPIMDKNEDQELDLSTNAVEACCNTDEGVDSDDVILHTNCMPMFENTPEKNPEIQDTFIQKNPSQINTTLIEKSPTNVISANQTQSPVIAWQGRDTSYLGKENVDDDPLNNSDDEMCGETERSADEIIEPSERDNEYIDFGESLDEVGVSTAEDTVDDGNTGNVDTTDGSCDKLAEEDNDENSGVIEITDNEKVMKLATKRKYNFDEDDFPKKQRQQTATLDTFTIITTPSKDNQVSHFKTPVSALRSKNSTTPSKCYSPNDLSSTQLMGSTQSPHLDGFSMSKVSQLTNQLEVKASDKARSPMYCSKAKDLLAKLRAKKAMELERVEEIVSSLADNSSQELCAPERIQRPTAARMMLEKVDTHVGRCKEVINKLKEALECETGLNNNPRVQAWREELSDVEAKLTFPKTVIAVVGDTGAGKSSLLNAILDHRSVLPTSGMRACTAVVVEVVQNTSSTQFEADIEFLQEKEWLDELRILLEDFTGLDGEVKNRQPDLASEAYVSYCKIWAVYGKIDKFSILSLPNTVTHWLGKNKTIRSTNPEEFRKLVEEYIETQDPGAGGQYWPIVKHVVLKLPNCDVCSSGASLVDLPGIRDSNAARDKIAREYLKNCTAVWVVSSIHRAIDDKTAKELLGENFRRQLLMDGQYGSIAFICTKTDVLMPSEIIRSLELEDKTLEHDDKVKEMVQCKREHKVIVCRLKTESKTLKKNVEDKRLEVQELRDIAAGLDSLLDSTDINNEETDEYKLLKDCKDNLNSKENELETAEQRIRNIESEKTESTQKMLKLEHQMNFHRKAKAAICACARNEYSKSEIKRDFKAGLREMKRQAGMLNDDDDEHEDEDDENTGSTADNLRVFCCSSTEYQKIKNPQNDDGPPQVFSTLEDTQIPNLRNYVYEMTSMQRQQSVEKLIRSLRRFVFDLQSYTAHGQSVSTCDRLNAKNTIEAQLKKFDQTLEPMLCAMSADITEVFDGNIRLKMEEGASTATKEANTTCAIWGSAINKENKKDRKLGGLHLNTYKAMVRGHGFCSSRTFGNIDFNEALSEPMFRSLTIVWDKAFTNSGMLWEIMDKIKTNILIKLKELTNELCLQLESVGVSKERAGQVSAQLHDSASAKLTETVGTLKEIITNNQREISRIVTPHIQSSLLKSYVTCAKESGPGMFSQMKDHMTKGVDDSRISMFDKAKEKLMNKLVELQKKIMYFIRKVCKTLHHDLKTAFEPMWDDPSNFRILRDAFLKPVTLACAEVRSIYDGAHLENTEEKIVIPVNRASMSSSMTSVGRVNQASTSSSMTSVGRGNQASMSSYMTSVGRENQASTSSLMTSSCNTFEKFSPTKVGTKDLTDGDSD